MAPQDAQQLLYNAAVTQAFARGFRLGPGADSDMMAYAASAVGAIFASPSEADQDAALERGVRSFRLVVDTMIAFREEAYRGNDGLLQSNIIGEDTLRWARDKLCPGLWPFC